MLDDLEGELPSEVHAILESVEEKPMGTEIDDIEPTISPKEEAPRSVSSASSVWHSLLGPSKKTETNSHYRRYPP